MLPLSDLLRARSFPFVNVALIVANFLVWIFYEIPNPESSVDHWSFYPCAVNGSCHAAEPWLLTWFTAMFMHASWDHILGNMLFLAIFGKNVEDAYGHLRYLVFYFAGGFAATMTQTAMTLWFGTAQDARVPSLGASGAIAAVLGAYFILGGWFLYQLVEANRGLLSPDAEGGGVAFFAHVGGFAFGAVVTLVVQRLGWVTPQDYDALANTQMRTARPLWNMA